MSSSHPKNHLDMKTSTYAALRDTGGKAASAKVCCFDGRFCI